jgi:site-specific recombinase XerD
MTTTEELLLAGERLAEAVEAFREEQERQLAGERLETAVGKFHKVMDLIAGVPGAHNHRFRHTLATQLLAAGATYEDVGDILGSSTAIIRKHYAQWSSGRQERISSLLQTVFSATYLRQAEKESVSADFKELELVDGMGFEGPKSPKPQ